MLLTTLQHHLCKTQGDLFEMIAQDGYDCDEFVKVFMNSPTAKAYDSSYDQVQWAGKEYILEELEHDSGGLPRSEYIYDPEAMFWMGYTYRYWHFYTGESSKDIYKYANAEKMARTYPGLHTLDSQEAIDRLTGRD